MLFQSGLLLPVLEDRFQELAHLRLVVCRIELQDRVTNELILSVFQSLCLGLIARDDEAVFVDEVGHVRGVLEQVNVLFLRFSQPGEQCRIFHRHADLVRKRCHQVDMAIVDGVAAFAGDDDHAEELILHHDRHGRPGADGSV